MRREWILVGTILSFCACRTDPRGPAFSDCEAGEAEACERLAVRFARGTGGVVDGLAARAFFSRACSLGSAKACTVPGADEGALVRTLEKGQPLPAEEWRPFPEVPELTIKRSSFSLSAEAITEIIRLRGDCAAGHLDACVDAARLSINASEFVFGNPIELVPVDLARAARLLDAPCQAGHARACGLRAWTLADPKMMRHACALGWGPACAVAAGWTAEKNERARLANQACSAGVSLGCGGVYHPEWLTKECETGDVMACVGLGAEKTVTELQRACQKGKPTACLEMQRDADPNKVEAMLRKACGTGHLPACRQLADHLKSEEGPRLSRLLTARGYRRADSFRHEGGVPVAPPNPSDVTCGADGCRLRPRPVKESDLQQDALDCAHKGMGMRPYQLFPETDLCARVLYDLHQLRPTSQALIQRLAHRACRPDWPSFWPCLIVGARAYKDGA